MGNYANSEMKGDNSGCGNRAVADHIRSVHSSKNGGDWTSSQIRPDRSLAHAPGAASSVLKTPRATKRPIDD